MNEPLSSPSPSEVLSDDEIVRRVVEGETPLFEILMRRHNQRVYRAVRGIIRDDGEAEDAMQQAWVNAFAHLSQFEQRAKFSTWLTRIAIHEALGRVRRRSTTLQLLSGGTGEDEIAMDVESTSADPEQNAMGSELRDRLEMEIASLPDTYRAALILREVEGLSTAEAAECLGINEDLVKQRLHRARAMIRERLYDGARLSFRSLYPFMGSRCDAMVARVMEAIGRK